jgi:hypothetical protein
MFNPRLFLNLCLLLAVANTDLSSNQARKAIQTTAGISLPSDSVRVQRIEGAEATAELQLVFRVTQHEGRWHLSEVRTGADRWEPIDLIARAAKFELGDDDCDARSEFARTKESTDLTTKRARCMVASLFGVALPSDQVRIREVSPFGLSFGSSDASALITALVELDFRFARDARGWQVTSIKSRNHDWIDLSGVTAAIDQLKSMSAKDDLVQMAQALDSYHRDRGFYVPGDKQSVLIDHLSPKYLTRVIRVDPWHHPYSYTGAIHYYVIRSLGPDGKLHTPDDISVDYTNPPPPKTAVP